MENSGLTASDVALMTRDNGAFGADGGAFMWIFALLILAGGGFGGFGWGDNGYRPQFATQDFVQNGFNFNDLQSQNRDIMNAINSGTAQAVAATSQAKYDNINVMKDIQNQLQLQLSGLGTMEQAIGDKLQQCCCETQRAIDGVNYNAAMNTAAINENTTAQTQKILDAITGNRMAEMQNQINQLQLQAATSNVLRYPTAWTYNAGMSPFCGCGCGCGA